MRNTEVRIGNLVNAKGIGAVNVFEIKKGELHPDLSPINILEVHLDMFGFEKEDNDYMEKKLRNGFYLGAYRIEGRWEIILTDEQNNELTLVKHVHKLQNLYYSLTETELKK